jgi:hypothetical protein
MHPYVCMYVRTYAHTYVCMYICMCLYDEIYRICWVIIFFFFLQGHSEKTVEDDDYVDKDIISDIVQTNQGLTANLIKHFYL